MYILGTENRYFLFLFHFALKIILTLAQKMRSNFARQMRDFFSRPDFVDWSLNDCERNSHAASFGCEKRAHETLYMMRKYV